MCKIAAGALVKFLLLMCCFKVPLNARRICARVYFRCALGWRRRVRQRVKSRNSWIMKSARAAELRTVRWFINYKFIFKSRTQSAASAQSLQNYLVAHGILTDLWGCSVIELFMFTVRIESFQFRNHYRYHFLR